MHAEDITGIVTLTVLYFIQGILLGLPLGSLPVLILGAGADYQDISLLTFSSIFFSLKFLWASVLDTHFIASIGKRKTYILPCNYITGALLLYIAYQIDAWFAQGSFFVMTVLFYIILFLAATADIATDGWALTLLSHDNVGYQSTCQSAGQFIGWFISQFILIQLSSVEWCNSYIFSTPRDVPLVTVAGYMKFFGYFTLIVTVLVQFFKKETNPEHREEATILEIFKLLKAFTKVPYLRLLCIVLLTWKIGFSPVDAGGSLELIRKGFPKEWWATIGIILAPVQVLIAVVTGHFVVRKIEWSIFILMYIIRLIGVAVVSLTVFSFDGPEEASGIYFWVFLYALIYNVSSNMEMVCLGAFFARICDPSIGGTFITAMNSMTNVGKVVFQPISLSLIGLFGFKSMAILGFVFQAVYLIFGRGRIVNMQYLEKKYWKPYPDSPDRVNIPLLDLRSKQSGESKTSP